MDPRDYQIEGEEGARDAFRRGVMRVLYQLPTGGGKTVMFCSVARQAARRSKRVCILVHRRELVRQTCEKLEFSHGVIAAGHRERNEWIQVASKDTLLRRLDRHQFDLIIVDEAHHATAGTYLKVINANPTARVLGVTATPCRMTGRGLGDLFEELILGPSVAELTDRGYLAPAVVYAPDTVDMSGVDKLHGDYKKSAAFAKVDKPKITGCAIQHYREHAHQLPALAFCVNRKHAELVAEAFRRAGYRWLRVDGTTPDRERDAAVRDLGRNQLDGISSCELFDEGLDIPALVCMIGLRPTHSLTKHIQMMGRALRPAPGKDHAIILDHVGNVARHKHLPTTEQDWTLDAGAVKKAADDEPAVQIRQCMQCYHVHTPAPRCPQCGYEYPVKEFKPPEEVEGVLKKLDPEALEKKRARCDVGRARSRDDLLKIAEERGYKPGWVDHIMNAREQKRAPATAGVA